MKPRTRQERRPSPLERLPTDVVRHIVSFLSVVHVWKLRNALVAGPLAELLTAALHQRLASGSVWLQVTAHDGPTAGSAATTPDPQPEGTPAGRRRTSLQPPLQQPPPQQQQQPAVQQQSTAPVRLGLSLAHLAAASRPSYSSHCSSSSSSSPPPPPSLLQSTHSLLASTASHDDLLSGLAASAGLWPSPLLWTPSREHGTYVFSRCCPLILQVCESPVRFSSHAMRARVGRLRAQRCAPAEPPASRQRDDAAQATPGRRPAPPPRLPPPHHLQQHWQQQEPAAPDQPPSAGPAAGSAATDPAGLQPSRDPTPATRPASPAPADEGVGYFADARGPSRPCGTAPSPAGDEAAAANAAAEDPEVVLEHEIHIMPCLDRGFAFPRPLGQRGLFLLEWKVSYSNQLVQIIKLDASLFWLFGGDGEENHRLGLHPCRTFRESVLAKREELENLILQSRREPAGAFGRLSLSRRQDRGALPTLRLSHLCPCTSLP